MLDTETKRRIDEARDILVGKLPDPKSQVEQITIALIYKFMYDMDKEALDFGGKATFFTGEWEKYNWINIFDPKIGGHEMLNLYGEAIVKLNQNRNIPQLFRDIFKNAYLPYRDPETLKLFLKTINAFHYDHSEMLGDAFEYLLSVLGSQGDAGQFRTPRHIIDFIVDVLQPKKNETICDPACGTAGFLISSYKYIVAQNTKKNKGDLLTPDDKKKMMQRFTGYDISPDMVRLSLVNMYLHNFTTPKIYEYDTLTSEDRWNESFDIIMANPPFMSPKGGIKPHKKFSIQANRSEVLFVDYIMEHINPATGRAGVIVPEGIIFQSANAYKQLRQALVDKKYLYAVVSLPAGIFQPYSGVKTSILFMDRTIAKKTDNILFVKIENDGFDLGAQRRAIDKNDLTTGLIHLQEYKEAILNNTEFVSDNKNAFVVDKKTIKGSGDYNLSVDRYRVNENVRQSNFEMIRLQDVCEIKKGSSITKNDTVEGVIPVIAGGQQPAYFHNEANRSGEVITVSSSGAYAGFVNYFNTPIFASDCTTIQTTKDGKILCVFLYHLLKSKQNYFYNLQKGGGQPHVYGKDFGLLEIPLPPLSIQQQIVNKIESYLAIINGAKQVVKNYKPQIDIEDDWEMVELGEVCEINPKKSELKLFPDSTKISFVPMADLNENRMDFVPKEERQLSEVIGGYTYFKNHDVLVAKVTPCFENGKAGIAGNLKNKIGFGSSEYYVLRCKEIVLPVWIYLQITSDEFRRQGTEQMTGTGGLQRVPKEFVKNFQIPLPPLSTQQQIVDRIEQEQQLVNANKELIKIYEQKIKEEINTLWKPAVKEEKVGVVAEE
jgi:type I restriction enzyme M protein